MTAPKLDGIDWIGDGYRVLLSEGSHFVDEMQAARTIAEQTECCWIVYVQDRLSPHWSVYAFSDRDEAEDCVMMYTTTSFMFDGREIVPEINPDGGYRLPQTTTGGGS